VSVSCQPAVADLRGAAGAGDAMIRAQPLAAPGRRVFAYDGEVRGRPRQWSRARWPAEPWIAQRSQKTDAIRLATARLRCHGAKAQCRAGRSDSTFLRKDSPFLRNGFGKVVKQFVKQFQLGLIGSPFSGRNRSPQVPIFTGIYD